MSSHSTVAGRLRASKAASVSASPLGVSEETIKRLTDVFNLLADKSRLKIVLALAREGELHVSALCELLGRPGEPLSQPAVSHHLTLMRMVGLVAYRRDGKHNYYYLAGENVRDLLEQFFSDCGNGHKALQFPDFSLSFRRR